METYVRKKSFEKYRKEIRVMGCHCFIVSEVKHISRVEGGHFLLSGV